MECFDFVCLFYVLLCKLILLCLCQVGLVCICVFWKQYVRKSLELLPRTEQSFSVELSLCDSLCNTDFIHQKLLNVSNLKNIYISFEDGVFQFMSGLQSFRNSYLKTMCKLLEFCRNK